MEQEQTKQPSFLFPIANARIETEWQLNEQQQKALIELEGFARDPEQSQFTLSGYAGTGKTSILKLFHTYMCNYYRPPIYSAPTHRALCVISQMNPSAKTATLAKIFGLLPQLKIEDGGYTLEEIEFSQQKKPIIERGDFLIIDECSMVNEALYSFIQENIYSLGLKVLYVGDSAQIKPVKETNISPVFTNKHGTTIILTKVERTGDNPILKEATDLRNGLDFSRKTSVNDAGHGVEYLSKPQVRDIIKREFPTLSTNPLHIRCLAGTRAVVQKSNDIIRQILNCREQLEVGEVVMGYDNFGYDYALDSYKIINSGDYHVKSSIPNNHCIENVWFSGYSVMLQNAMTHETQEVFVVDNNEDPNKIVWFASRIHDLSITAEKFRRYKNTAKAAEYYGMLNDLKSQLAFMKDHYNRDGKLILYKTLDYGYSHTIHKSQGGTYEKVLIIEDSLKPFNEDQELKQQLKYVALSRAKQNVFIV